MLGLVLCASLTATPVDTNYVVGHRLLGPVAEVASWVGARMLAWGGEKTGRRIAPALGYRRSAFVRATVARALGEIGGSNATQALRNRLSWTDPITRLAIIRALGRTRDLWAIVPLVEQLDNGSGIGLEARSALTRLALSLAPAHLEAILLNQHAYYDIAPAVIALAVIGTPRSLAAVDSFFVAIPTEDYVPIMDNLGRLGGRNAARLLETAQRCPDPDVRYSAVDNLQRVDSARALVFLEQALHDSVPLVRMQAVQIIDPNSSHGDSLLKDVIAHETDVKVFRAALSRVASSEGSAVLMLVAGALQSPDTAIVIAALDKLSRFPDPPVAAAVALMLNHPSSAIRAIAARDYPYTPPWSHVKPPPVAPLLPVLTDTSTRVRREAVNSLRSRRDTSATYALLAALSDEDTVVRLTALSALGRTADRRALGPLLALMDSSGGDTRAGATWAVAMIGGDSAIAPLERALADTSPCVRTWAADGLGRTDLPSAILALVGALVDEDLTVRFAAVRALGMTRSPAAAGPLTEVTRLAPVGRFAQASAAALATLGPVGVESLCGLLADTSTFLRLTAAGVLARDTSRVAVTALLAAARHRDIPILVGIHDFYIHRNEPWLDTLLVVALRQQGDMQMASAMYYNSRRPYLIAAARNWNHGKVPSLAFGSDRDALSQRRFAYDWRYFRAQH